MLIAIALVLIDNLCFFYNIQSFLKEEKTVESEEREENISHVQTEVMQRLECI